MTFLFYLTMVLFIIVCLFLILLILIQKGRGGGLAGAFGGGGGGNTAFGAKTGDVLTWATSIVFGIFLVLAIALNIFANQVHEGLMATRERPEPDPALVDTAQPRPAPEADPNRPLTPIEIDSTVPPRGGPTEQTPQP